MPAGASLRFRSLPLHQPAPSSRGALLGRRALKAEGPSGQCLGAPVRVEGVLYGQGEGWGCPGRLLQTPAASFPCPHSQPRRP